MCVVQPSDIRARDWPASSTVTLIPRQVHDVQAPETLGFPAPTSPALAKKGMACMMMPKSATVPGLYWKS